MIILLWVHVNRNNFTTGNVSNVEWRIRKNTNHILYDNNNINIIDVYNIGAFVY